MKINRSPQQNQQKPHPAQENSFYSVYNTAPQTTQDHVTDVLHNKLLDSDRAVLNYLIWLSRKMNAVFVSHARIAKAVQRSVSCIRDAIERLKKHKLLVTHYHHEYTLSYHLPQIFKKDTPFQLWARILQVYAFFSLNFLFAEPGGQLVNNKGFIYRVSSRLSNGNATVGLYETESFGESLEGDCHKQRASFEELETIFGESTVEPLSKKRERMKMFPEYVESVTELQLTDHGKAKISCYPEEAIKYAQHNFKFVANAKNKFRAFQSLADQWCVENEAKQLWEAYYGYKRALSLKGTEPYYIESLKKSPETGKSESTLPKGAPTYEQSLRTLAKHWGYAKFRKNFSFQGLTEAHAAEARRVFALMEAELLVKPEQPKPLGHDLTESQRANALEFMKMAGLTPPANFGK